MRLWTGSYGLPCRRSSCCIFVTVTRLCRDDLWAKSALRARPRLDTQVRPPGDDLGRSIALNGFR